MRPSLKRLLFGVPPEAYLLRDDFTDERAAGAVNGTPAVPGPGGNRTVTDADNLLSIGGGKLSFATDATPVNSNPIINYTALIRTAGRMMLASFNRASGSRTCIGLDTVVQLISNNIGFMMGWVGGIDVKWLTSNIQVGTYSNGTELPIAAVLRAAGGFYFAKISGYWVLLCYESFSSGATLYPLAAAGSLAAAWTIDKWRIPVTRWLPTPLASDGFSTTTTDGLGHAETSGVGAGGAGLAYATAATWAVAGGVCNNTPTPGSELFDAAAAIFTSGTYGWVAQGTNLIANVANALQITYVDSTAGALEALNNATDLSADLVVGTWYCIAFDSKVNAGSVNWVIAAASLGAYRTVTETNFTAFRMTWRALTTTGAQLKNGSLGAGEVVSIDNLTLKPLTLAELFRPLAVSFTADVIAQIKIAAMTAGTQAGLAIRLNSPTAPTAGIVAYFGGEGNIFVDQFSGSTWTQLFTAAKAFTANDSLQLIADGANIRLIHLTSAGVPTLIGSTAAATITTGGYHGQFSTDPGNTLDNFVLYPRGTGGEYAALNRWSN